LRKRRGRSRRAIEDMKRSRIAISGDSQFTGDEIEVAGILTFFKYYWRLFLQWVAKHRPFRERSSVPPKTPKCSLGEMREKTIMSFNMVA
jgi:hypothetical protein